MHLRRGPTTVRWDCRLSQPAATPFLPPAIGIRGHHTMLDIAVILGSTRRGRFGEKPARWIFDELKKRQKADGSWSNTNRAFLETVPELATAFALLALSYCTKK